MRESIELRVLEKHAHKVFPPGEGKILGSGTVRKIAIPTSDPRLQRISEIQNELRSQDDSLFFGWRYIRRYDDQEIAEARAFLVSRIATFEPAGEEAGTEYADTTACPICHAGRRQVSTLRLPVTRIPKGVHLARTIAGEIVISRDLADAATQAGIQGLNTGHMEPARSRTSSSEWLQLRPEPAILECASSLRIGIDPFDLDKAGRYRCPLGCTLGLNLLSELTLHEPALANADIGFTRVRIGVRRGLLNPESLLVISPRLYKLLRTRFDRRVECEVAKVVTRAA